MYFIYLLFFLLTQIRLSYQVVDKSPENYGKVLASFNAGDEAVKITTRGESMSLFFEANPGGYTKNEEAPVWRAAYYVIEMWF